MVLNLDSGTRRARKTYRCGMCNALIRPGDLYAYQSNVYDEHVYTWRECLPCERDGIVNCVTDWTGGYRDEGVDYEAASEWAEETANWPARIVYRNREMLRFPTSTNEQRAARNWLARASGDE